MAKKEYTAQEFAKISKFWRNSIRVDRQLYRQILYHCIVNNITQRKFIGEMTKLMDLTSIPPNFKPEKWNADSVRKAIRLKRREAKKIIDSDLVRDIEEFLTKNPGISIREMARELNYSRKKIMSTLKELEDCGILIVDFSSTTGLTKSDTEVLDEAKQCLMENSSISIRNLSDRLSISRKTAKRLMEFIKSQKEDQG